MKQSIKILKIATEEKIKYILDNVCGISQTRIEAAVNSMYSDEECMMLMGKFSKFKNDFAIESYQLDLHKGVYNQQYSSEVNGMYNSAYSVLINAKKQLFFLYNLMNSFSKKPVQSNGFIQVATGNIEWVANHSMIGLRPIQLEIFSKMNPIRRALVTDIYTFLCQLEENLNTCLSVVDEENAIRADYKRVLYLFERQVDEVFKYLKDVKKKRKTDGIIYQDLLDYKNNPEVIAKYFHVIGTKDFVDVASGIKDKMLSEYSSLQRRSYAEDIKKMDKFRFVVSQVDEKIGKITGDLLLYIYKYTECEVPRSSFLKCFEEEYRRIGGKQKVVSNAALSRVFNEEGYKEFCSIVDDLYLTRPITSSHNTSDSDSSSAYLQQ